MWIVPKRISACIPGEVDWTSDLDECAQMLSASATWNTKQAQPRSWLTTLKRNYWMRLLCTRMPSLFQQGSFTDWWTGSLAARRASRSPSRGSNSAQTIPETSGRSLSEWWQTFSQQAASSRTSHQPTLFGTSTRKSSPDFDIWATKLRQEYSQRLRSARHTTESESSFWDSPQATMDVGNGFRSSTQGGNLNRDAVMSQTPANFQGKYRRQANQTERNEMLLPGQAENWATPAARDGKGHTTTENHPEGFTKSLGNDVQNWMTPTTQDAGKATKKIREDHQNNLTSQMAQWPTPTARDHKGDYSDEAITRKDGKSRLDNLPTITARWKTPSANEDAAGTVSGNMQQMLSHQAQQVTGVTSQNDSGRRLNPTFVTWLMNWPEGWLRFHALKNSESSETE